MDIRFSTRISTNSSL
uniref:Uncharacterized protein n=1 Tax=Arundo donax TaxID=35708 RepID=A0A0A8ZEK9_ARUDO